MLLGRPLFRTKGPEPMPFKLVYAMCLGISSVMLAQGAADVAADSTFGAIGELGLAIVIAATSFFLLVWWFKTNVSSQREDATRMATRITELEKFQQDQMIKLVQDVTTTHVQAAEETHKNTEQMLKMTDAMARLSTRLDGRLCLAIESMCPENRKKVYEILGQKRE